MKLIYSAASPFARKVNVLLRETGQTDDVDLVEVATTPVSTPSEVRAANPIGKIPALAMYSERWLIPPSQHFWVPTQGPLTWVNRQVPMETHVSG